MILRPPCDCLVVPLTTFDLNVKLSRDAINVVINLDFWIDFWIVDGNGLTGVGDPDAKLVDKPIAG